MDDHSLFGVLQHHQSLPPEQLQPLLDQVWGMPGRFSITHSLGKKFIFHFETKEERDLVLEDTPWAVNGMFLMLKSLNDETDVDLERLEIVATPIWMQVHGIPYEYVSSVGQPLGSLAGEVMKVDEQCMNSQVRVQVKIDPESPLLAGTCFIMNNGESIWLQFKYERVFALCFSCGRIGHSVESCDLTPEAALRVVGERMVEAARRAGVNTRPLVRDAPLYSRSVLVYGASGGSKSNKMIIYDAEDGMPPVEPEFFKYIYGGYDMFGEEERWGMPPLIMYVMRKIVRGKVEFERIEYQAIREARES